MWITVPIVCIIEDIEADQIREANVILENLSLPLKAVPEPQTELREGELNTKLIVTYYPSHNAKKTIVECVGGSSYSVALPKAELKELIRNAETNG